MNRSASRTLALLGVTLIACVPLYLLWQYGGLSGALNVVASIVVSIPGTLAILWVANRRR
jgi:hypothetical protein